MNDTLALIIGNNIKRLREAKGLTQEDLVQAIGSGNYQQISKYERGENRPGETKLKKIAEALGVSVNELTGRGISITKPVLHQIVRGQQTAVCYLAGAGDPRVSSGEIVISIALPEDFTKYGIVPVVVKGDSMKPVLLDGAIVGVDTGDKDVVSGKMYAVWIQDEGALIKTLLVGYDSVIVKSENPLAHSFEVPKSALHDHFVLGKVKWWINQEVD